MKKRSVSYSKPRTPPAPFRESRVHYYWQRCGTRVQHLSEPGRANSRLQTEWGVTLIELMVVLAILGVVMGGLYTAYVVNVRESIKQYTLAQSEMEFQISKSVIERDLAMAGYGIMDSDDSYTLIAVSVPRHAAGTDVGPDTLTLTGTALGKESRATQEWSIYSAETPTGTADDFITWTTFAKDENLKSGDRIIYMEPNDKALRYLSTGVNPETGKSWLFTYPPNLSSSNMYPTLIEPNLLVYGLQTTPTSTASLATLPYYTVKYYMGGTAPSLCAAGTSNLLRAESRTSTDPGSGEPLVNCVLDFQVAFGLDATTADGSGPVSCWDNGGDTKLKTYTTEDIRRRLKQIRVYILAQDGKQDLDYTYNPATIRVGDDTLVSCLSTGVGRDKTLTAEQQHYRWKVISVNVAPRNIRL